MNYEFADMVIILYFRALCLDCFEKRRKEYEVFYLDNRSEFYKI